MLKVVAIENFQSLENINFILHEGLNVIVGPSDIGKSAVLRAIMSAVRSSSGDKFITNGKASTRVCLEFDDLDLKWSKSRKSGAKYELNNSEIFEKFGSNFPSDIEDALNLSKVNILGDDVDINFTDQFTLPFLLFDTPLNRARLINELAGLSILSKSMQEARKRHDNFNSNKTRLESELDEISDQLTRYADVDLLQNYSVDLKKYYRVYGSLSGDASRINSLVLPDLVPDAIYHNFTETLSDFDSYYKDLTNLSRYVLPVYVDPDLIDSLKHKVENLDNLRTDYDKLNAYVLPPYVDSDLLARLDKLVRFSDIVAADYYSINNLHSHLPEITPDFDLGDKLANYDELETDAVRINTLYSSLGYDPTSAYTELESLDYVGAASGALEINALYLELDTLSNAMVSTEDKIHELGIEICPVCEREF